MLIDLHAHLLPGVDDGAKSRSKSLELAQLADEEGISHLVLTPHHLNGKYQNPAQEVIAESRELQRIYQEKGIKLRVFPAQEIRLTEDFLDEFYANNLLSLDGRGKYYLIEFPTREVPEFTEDILDTLVERGITPIVAHPERNQEIMENPNLLYDLVQMGCLAQLTSSSLTGLFGPKYQDIAYQFIEHNLVHIIASDAHHMTKRPFNMKEAYQHIRKIYGEDLVRYYQENARLIFNGESIVKKTPVEIVENKRKWWSLFGKG